MKSKENSTTLINLFDNLGKDFTRGVSMIEFSKQCALIADEFAIGFAEWLLKNYDGLKSVKELLKIYKKENGL
jgi:hypothetical protein